MKRLHTYSQHFLRSPSLVKELFGHSKLKKTDTVLDIGAGSGVITSVLAEKVRKVIAIEAEPGTVKILRKNTADYNNVLVVQADALQIDLPKEPYSIFSNIPFHLSSPLIERLINTNNPPQKTYLIVQKQFGRKLVATDNRFFTGQLGVLLCARYDVKIRKPLKRTDFWPHPAVDTVFIEILLKNEPLVKQADFEKFKKLVKSGFSSPEAYHKFPLNKAGVSPEKKPSQLTIDQWVSIFEATKGQQV